jgi:hypothetical protein
MNTNIEITNIDKTFFYLCQKSHNKKTYEENDKENDKENDEKNKYKTKIVNYCFYTSNEWNISNKIKKIKYYLNRYHILEEYDFLNISQLSEKVIEKLNLSDEKEYLIFRYKNEKLIQFNDFLLNIDNPKLFIFHTIESFSYLLKNLIQLNENNIVFFNLSPDNIAFNLDCGEKPVIQNFQLSLHLSKLNEMYISNIINKLDDYTHKPLEVQILFYIIKNDISTISQSFIEEVCDIFVKNLSVLTLFSDKYKESYKAGCLQYFKKYIDKPKSVIILDILEDYDKWDVYSLSLLYLHIFGNISRIFSLKDNFISKILNELSNNISPDPSKRSSLECLLENFDKFLNTEKDWSFVNKLSLNKMTQLIDILGK